MIDLTNRILIHKLPGRSFYLARYGRRLGLIIERKDTNEDDDNMRDGGGYNSVEYLKTRQLTTDDSSITQQYMAAFKKIERCLRKQKLI